MHDKKRPAADISMPMQWEGGGGVSAKLLSDIAYFNSLRCKAIIRFYSQHVVNKNCGAKEPNRWGDSA